MVWGLTHRRHASHARVGQSDAVDACRHLSADRERVAVLRARGAEPSYASHLGDVVGQLGAMYGEGARALQDEFDSRRLADRLAEVTLHDELDEGDIALIGEQAAVLVSTVDSDGWPDVSSKGGDRGFVSVVSPTELWLPICNGNGMWRTLGNIRDTGRVALLFVDQQRPWRMRLHGTGLVLTDVERVSAFVGAEAVERIRVARVFSNCGRYIHRNDELSPFVPRQTTRRRSRTGSDCPSFATCSRATTLLGTKTRADGARLPDTGPVSRRARPSVHRGR